TVTFEPFDRFSKMRYHWIPWIKTNSTFNGDNFRLYRFSVIPGFIKNPLKAYTSYNQIKITRDDLQTKPTPPTIKSKSPEMIFRPSLTKFIQQNFDPHNRLSGTATQIQQKSSQTGSEVISQQIFQISTPNLVCTWKTLQQD